jgi:PAS domain S-box-containing protein
MVQEARGRKVEEIFLLINEKTRQPVASPVERIQREGKGMELTDHTLLLARDGRAIPIANSGAPIRGKSGHVEGVVLVFRDITEKKQIEDALIRAKEAAEASDRSKSEFLATMSHELRTPLHVILGYTSILLEDGCNNIPAEELKTTLRKIDQNARVLCELINMVLDLNHLEAGRLHVEVKPVQLTDLIGEIRVDMQGLCDQSGLTFVWNVEELPVLQTDPGKLKVVIKNLVGNAIKFTNEGSVTIDTHAHANGVEIRVADTGIGIPSDAYSLIFEPFRQIDHSATRLYGGSGLGLHIVKRLLGLLKGTVTVASQVGQGSTFRVWLPVNSSLGRRSF